ncbi:hypothetical protein AS156_01700 [Bradyrhizobium macuxiense]|uniref:Uncharacterized protein n=1 Tax=Bradyrhizobium macuxiense TaxID=1755647 RepID=A0A109JCS4_9BRAD|nr:hypothetical protein [Bradyrhizobium macuxiense]KWV46527.1 hypothetical protein AS156_01700 [Bradyrhizobium macuxiense]
MIGLAILFAAVGLGFLAGYGTRGAVSRRRRAEVLAYATYFERPHDAQIGTDAGRPSADQPRTSVMMRALASLADGVSFAVALDFALALLVILLLSSLLQR